jgi:hypothetical protein
MEWTLTAERSQETAYGSSILSSRRSISRYRVTYHDSCGMVTGHDVWATSPQDAIDKTVQTVIGICCMEMT